MIIEIGHFSVVVALVLSVLGIGSSIAALRTRNPDWVRVGRISVTLIFAIRGHGNETGKRARQKDYEGKKPKHDR